MRPKYLETGADISEDGIHRYWLSRRLGMGERVVVFCGLNPSTATKDEDDPTVRREVDFARQWGFDWYIKVNVCAYRSTDPKVLKTLDALLAVGPHNQEAVKMWMQRAKVIVAAWGKNPLNTYAAQIAALILRDPRTRCLGLNNDGTPKHPLYLPKVTQLQAVSSVGT